MKMRSLRTATVCCVVWLATIATASASGESHDLAGVWSMHTGPSRILQLEAGTLGETNLVGRLDDLEISGFVAGGEFVLHGDGILLWGWLGRDADGQRFLAGRRRDTSGDIDRVSGWYAVETPVQAGIPADQPETAESDARVQAFDLVLPETSVPISSDEPAPSSTESSAAGGHDGTGTFEGSWQGPDGLYRIEQQGSRITVLTPVGESVEGRQIDVGSLMVGLRVGCCRGELSAPDVIEWQDGVVWRRAD